MFDPNGTVRIAPWKDGKRFAYSITYDEGLVETAGFAWRIHRDYGIPGHINVFPHMLGKLVGDTSAGFLQSLWNLQKYAELEQLQFLLHQGWTIGCQFHPDERATVRLDLEKMLASPIRSLAFPDFKTCQANQEVAQQAGFRWLLALYDDLNAQDEHSHIIKRSPLYHRGPAPVRFAYDPYRLLASGWDRGGWVVDVVRLVDRYPLDPARDCTPAELERRFKAVREIGGDQVWTASPEAVAAYRALRLSTQVQGLTGTDQEISYTLAATDRDDFQPWDELTFVVNPRIGWASPRLMVGENILPLQPGLEPGTWLFTHQVADGLQIRLVNESGRSA